MSKDLRSRAWLVTQSAEKMTQEELQDALSAYTYIAQKEQGSGDTQYEHFQIYIENPQPIRFSSLKKKLPNAHLEVRRGNKKQAYEYCTKEDTRISEPFGNGEIDLTEQPGKRSDIEFLRELVLSGKPVSEILLTYPEAARYIKYLDRLFMEKQGEIFSKTIRFDLNVTYIHGAPGTGKTRYIYENYAFEEIYRVTSYDHPFDMYAGQKVLVLDEFHSQMPISLLLNILDIYPLQLPARYNNKWAGFEKVYIISNMTLDEQYSHIQVEKPLVWDALLRRIHEVREVN